MLITKDISIKISYNNKSYFSKLYPNSILKIGECIKIPIEQLSEGSHKKVLVECDICHIEKSIPYRDYISSINNGGYFTCYKCKSVKFEITNIKKYGVIHPMQSNIIKEKTKETNIKKYGNENVSKNKEVIEKIKFKVKQTYASEKNKEIKEKISKKIIASSKDALIKRKITNLNKYGVEHVSQNDEIIKKIILKSKLTREKTFINKYKHLDIRNMDYDNKIFEMKCDCGKDHYFTISHDLFQNRRIFKIPLCTICNKIGTLDSDIERQLYDFILEHYNGIINRNDRTLGVEFDIFLPKLKIAFEYNGLYWHSELFKDKDYHLNKTEIAEKNGIKLIHIFEDDWFFKENIVKSKIINLLDKSQQLCIEKCEIKEVNDNKLVEEFLNKNYIHGYFNSGIDIGLFYSNELISLMIFKVNGEEMKNDYEMICFCDKLFYTITGGIEQMFKYFINKYKPDNIISYVDRSWSNGSSFKQLGFMLDCKMEPDYYYFKNKKRYHRSDLKNDISIEQKYDSSKTEHENMFERKIYKIFDSGKLKFIWPS
jgi:hypothetical protein